MPCQHQNFEADVDVNRLEDSGRFCADIRIKCRDCGRPMRFLGLPMGLDFNGAAVNPNGQEARLAIHPAGEQVPGLNPDVPAGFNTFNHMPPER